MNPILVLWERLVGDRADGRRSARTGASDALSAAEGASGEVSRAVSGADRVARRTDRFIQEIDRSLHQRGTIA